MIDAQEVGEMELVNGLTSDTAVKTDDVDVETNVLTGMAGLPSEVEGDILVHGPLAHLDVSLVMTVDQHHLSQSRWKTFLQAVIITYKKYPTDKKFRVSGIVLKLQQVMSYDKITHSKS